MAKRFLLRWRTGYSAAIRTATVLVDDADAHRLRAYPWRVGYKKGVPAAVEHSWDSGRQKRSLARDIMSAADDEIVFHRNCDALDCRRSNLIKVKKAARGKYGRVYKTEEAGP